MIPSDVKVVEIIPASIKIKLSKLRRKRVPVQALLVNEPKAGYAVRGVTVNPSTIYITGPESVLKDIAVLDTEAVMLDGIKTDTVFEKNINRNQFPLINFNRDKIFKINVRITEKYMEKIIYNVPIGIRNLTNVFYVKNSNSFIIPNVSLRILKSEASLYTDGKDIGVFYNLTNIIKTGTYTRFVSTNLNGDIKILDMTVPEYRIKISKR
jgi:YbbR domain-containing protein